MRNLDYRSVSEGRVNEAPRTSMTVNFRRKRLLDVHAKASESEEQQIIAASGVQAKRPRDSRGLRASIQTVPSKLTERSLCGEDRAVIRGLVHWNKALDDTLSACRSHSTERSVPK